MLFGNQFAIGCGEMRCDAAKKSPKHLISCWTSNPAFAWEPFRKQWRCSWPKFYFGFEIYASLKDLDRNGILLFDRKHFLFYFSRSWLGLWWQRQLDPRSLGVQGSADNDSIEIRCISLLQSLPGEQVSRRGWTPSPNTLSFACLSPNRNSHPFGSIITISEGELGLPHKMFYNLESRHKVHANWTTNFEREKNENV